MQRLLLGLCLLATPVALAAPLPDLAITVQAKQQGCSSKVDFFITVKNLSKDAPADPKATAGDYIDLILVANSAGKPDPFAVDPIPDEIFQWTSTGLGPGEEAPPFVWTHDYQVPGSYHAWIMVDSISFVPGLETAGLPEVTKDNNIEDLIFDVSCVSTDAPDLVVTDLKATVNGPQVNYKATVGNIGNVDVTTPFYVDVKWDTAGACPPPGWNGPGDTFVKVTSLAAGAEATYDIQPPSTPGPGVHKSCAAVDNENAIVEKSESNNYFGPVTFELADVPPLKKCDLAITAFDVSVLGSAVTYSATVKNEGDAACSPTQMELYFHVPTEPVDVEQGDVVFDVPVLGPGQTKVFTSVRDPAANGVQHAWMWVDRANNVVEIEEKANNLVGPYEYQVLVAGDAPDLIVTGVKWSVAGGTIVYDVAVKNVGTAPAENAELDVFYDFPSNPSCTGDDISGVAHDYLLVTLAVGEEKTFQTVWEDPPSGDHTGWVKIDCLNILEESDDTNNDYGPIFAGIQNTKTNGPNLVIVDFKATVTCTTVFYLAVIENQGDADAGPFEVALFWDENITPVPCQDTEGDAKFFYDSLAPGQQLVLETKRENTPSAKYHSWVMADALCQVSETEEGDNIGTASDIVVDAIACECPQNTQILGTCNCGGETVVEGYCCNGAWQTDPFATCEDNPDGDAEGQAPDGGGDLPKINTDALGVTNGVVSFSGQVLTEGGGGCAATGTPGAPWAAALLFVLMLALRGLRRRTRT